MRIDGEAPGRRALSGNRLEGQDVVSGITATSDRYRRLVNRPTAEIYA